MKKSSPTCRFLNRAIVGPLCDWACSYIHYDNDDDADR